jgi:hypothetical protein
MQTRSVGSAFSRSQAALFVFISAFFLVIASALLVYGRDYYFMDLATRPFSLKHAQLKPSGNLGLPLGIFGFCLFALVYLYPIRKHWTLLGRLGKTRNWFNWHVFLGLIAPVVITFHSAFKFQGFAGMAYWTMLALVGSGLVGRYFYAQIPRTISAAEMSLREMHDFKDALSREFGSQKMVRISEIESLFHLPDPKEVNAMPLGKALARMMWLDIVRPFRIWSLRRRVAQKGDFFSAGILAVKDPELEKVILLAARQAALSKRILFLSKTQRVFHLWHVIHRPFSISFAGFVIIHVGVVVWLGYF